MAGVKPKSSASDSGFVSSVQRFWRQKSYAGDYLGLVVLVAVYIIIQFDAAPFHRLFRLDDPRIQFPHAEKERVPVGMYLHPPLPRYQPNTYRHKLLHITIPKYE